MNLDKEEFYVTAFILAITIIIIFGLLSFVDKRDDTLFNKRSGVIMAPESQKQNDVRTADRFESPICRFFIAF